MNLKAEKRSIEGRKVKKLRSEGILPANIFGKKVKSQSVQVNLAEFQKVYKEVGETGLVELQVNGEKRPVLIHNLQLDPVSDSALHVDFLQVDLKSKVTAQIPVELVGEAPAEKQGLGTVVQYIDEIEVEALPTDLPDKFEINLASLVEVDQSVLVKDIPIDGKKVEVKTDVEQILVKDEPPHEEKEEVVAVPEEAPVAEGVSETPGEGAQPQEASSEGEKAN